jgi:hypothetical protein
MMGCWKALEAVRTWETFSMRLWWVELETTADLLF